VDSTRLSILADIKLSEPILMERFERQLSFEANGHENEFDWQDAIL
jgi:hypothetical protein